MAVKQLTLASVGDVLENNLVITEDVLIEFAKTNPVLTYLKSSKRLVCTVDVGENEEIPGSPRRDLNRGNNSGSKKNA